MTGGDGFDRLDPRRLARLGDVGLPGYVAAVVVDCDGETNLMLARVDAINDPAATYNAGCPDAPHDQLGPLPIEYVRRLTISRRRRRNQEPR